MKRILSVFAAFVIILFTMTAFAASGGEVIVRPVGTDGDMNISITLPDEFVDREIYVYILNPGMDISMLTDNNSQENSKVFQFGGQKAYIAGGIGFDFKMNTDNVDPNAEPVYKVYANAATGESFTFDFTYYNKEKKEELVTVIKNKQVTSGTAEEIYRVFSLQYLEIYDKADKGTLASLINEAAYDDMTADDVENIFAQAAVLSAASADRLTFDDLKKYSNFIGIEEEFTAEFVNLRESGIAILEEDINVSADNIDDFAVIVKKAILTAAVYGNVTEGTGVLDKVISDHRQFFAQNGLNMNDYDNSNKASVARTIISGTRLDFDAMVEKINDLTDNDGGGGTGGGGTGGGSSRPSGGNQSSGGGTPDSSQSVISGVPGTSTENNESSFTDLDEAPWAAESIERLFKAGVVSGKEYGKFMPNDTVTREEFVQMICGAFELSRGEETIGFTDVPTDRWSYQAIVTAASCRIVSGDGERFYPSDLITREDMAAILVRVLNYKNIYPQIDSYEMPFEDSDRISDYAYESVNILYQAKVISGKSETEFAPKDNATRAEAARMICGALDIM